MPFEITISDLFKYPWNSKKGLFVYIIFFILFCFPVVSFFHLIKPEYYEYSFFVFIFIPLFAFFWLIDRLQFFYHKDKLNIVFLFLIDYENKSLVEIYDATINLFRDKLDNYYSSRKVRIIEKPLDFSLQDSQWAERKVQAGGTPCSNLIIRGLPLTTKGMSRFKLKFSYEFRHPDGDKEVYKKIFSKNVDRAFWGRHWRILHESLEDVDLFAQNIFEISLFILGLTLYTDGKIDKAMEIFESIVEEYRKANLLKKKSMGPMIKKTDEILMLIYSVKIENLFWNYKEKEKEIVHYCEELFKIDKYSYGTLIKMAIKEEILGHRNDSKKYNESAKCVAKKEDCAHKFNNIYYCFCEENYKTGVKILNDLKEREANISVNFTRQFLYDKYEETDNLALLFECGFINLIWMGDEKNGKKDLKKFLEGAENYSRLSVLIIEANKLLKN